LWELCPFELKNFPKYTSEAAYQHNTSETTEHNFMKLEMGGSVQVSVRDITLVFANNSPKI
jgi:hypothetical protein